MREEIGELATSSEDENYPGVYRFVFEAKIVFIASLFKFLHSEGMPPKLTRRQKRQMMQLEASLSPEFGSVLSTFTPKSHSLGYGKTFFL